MTECDRIWIMNKKQIFSKIYDQQITKIFRFVVLKVDSQETAEDITAETFLRGWKSFQRTEIKIENFSAFLYQIARNLIIDHYREKGKRKIVTLENVTITNPISVTDNDPIKALHLDAETKIIKKALSNLKSDYQDVIIWYYLDELSISEISKIMDKQEGAVRVALHRALKALREKIQEA